MSISELTFTSSANSYYAGKMYWDIRNINTDAEEFDEEMEQGEKAYKTLRDYIKNDNLNGLIHSNKFKKFDINYRYGIEKHTLLHAAYRWNKPKIVEFLVKQGADERIPDDRGLVPIEVADEIYIDSLPRVINEVVTRYFKSLGNTLAKDPHVLFDVILNFIREKKWKYFDTEGSRKKIPFRDGRQLTSLGLPELAYHANCADLTNLFIKAAHKIGFDAKEEWYSEYISIKRREKEKAGIVGEFAMFDGSINTENYCFHCVAYSSNWYFDLLLMCKYQDRNAILKN